MIDTFWPLICYIFLFLSFSHCAGNPGHCWLLDQLPAGKSTLLAEGLHPVHLVTDILASKQNDTDLVSDAHKKLRPSFCGHPCKWWYGTQRMHMGVSTFEPWGKTEVKDHSALTLVCLTHKGVSSGQVQSSWQLCIWAFIVFPSYFVPHFPHKQTANLFNYWREPALFSESFCPWSMALFSLSSHWASVAGNPLEVAFLTVSPVQGFLSRCRAWAQRQAAWIGVVFSRPLNFM